MSGTRKQQEARDRAWRIRMLRGIYTQASKMFDREFADDVMPAVERALQRLGAQTMEEQHIAMQKEIASWR